MIELLFFTAGVIYLSLGLFMTLFIDQAFDDSVGRLVDESYSRVFLVWYLWPVSLPLCLLIHWWTRGRRKTPKGLG